MVPSMSRCHRRRNNKPPISGRKTLFVMFAASLLVALALGHLHLRFVLSDMRHETVALQNRKMELNSEINLLRGEVESRKQAEDLLEYAQTELGMVRYAAADFEHVSLTREASGSYRDAGFAPRKRDEADKNSERIRKGLDVLAGELGLDGRSFAGRGED